MKRLLKILSPRRLIILSLLLNFLVGNTSVMALSTEQKRILDSGVRYFDVARDCGGASSASTSSADESTFVVGDSVASGIPDFPGAKTQIESAFSAKQLPITVNAKPGRYIRAWDPDGLNPKESLIPGGLDAIAQDPAIKSATNVIIELGTNQGKSGGGWPSATTFTKDVGDMIDAVRNLNPNAKIYWVNIAVNTPRTSDLPFWSERNRIISEQSTVKNYSVIDWFGAAFPGGNAFNIPNTKSDLLDLIHASEAGKLVLAGLMANSITVGVGPDNGGSNVSTADFGSSEASCCSTANASSSLVGDERVEWIWNYLTSTVGLTPPQAAGVMGNLQAESTFRPEAEQTPGAWSDLSGARDHAVGIAQWDGGRRVALINEAKTQGKNPKDLTFQMDYLYKEAQGRQVDNTLRKTPPAALGAPNEWEGLKLMQSAQDATIFWHAEFEVSNDDAARVQNRVNFANTILAQFGSSTASASATGGGCGNGAVAGNIVQTAINLSWPAKGQGLVPKPEYAAAILQFNPASNNPTFYYGADCGSFVGTVMKASGADPDYPHASTSVQEAYVRAHPEKYDIVEVTTNKADLLPGDIMIVNKGGGAGSLGHTYIYVGPQAGGLDAASASGGERMPNLGGTVLSDERGNYLRARLK